MCDTGMMRILYLCWFVFATAVPGTAQSPDRAERIVQAWSDWIEAGGTTTATIAIIRNGELVAAEGISVSSDAALPLVSLSKAITAACVAELSEATDLLVDTTIGSIIDGASTVSDRTIAQLLTHKSGIWPDATQGDPSVRDGSSPQIGAVARRAMDRDPQQGQPGTYAYNNENYAIAGEMIETATGQPYADACMQAVLEPLDVRTGVLGGEWGPQGSWGGWSMSAPDYARFAWATFGPDAGIGQAPEDWPAAALGNGAHY